MDFTRAGHGNSPAPGPAPEPAPALASQPAKIEPDAPLRYRLEVSISAGLRDKLERLQNLMSHTVPNGSVAELLERAVDALLAKETKRRLGAGKPRKRRLTEPGSRHIPVEDARAPARDQWRLGAREAGSLEGARFPRLELSSSRS